MNDDGTAGTASTLIESPAGRIKAILDADDGLVFPSDVLFGTAPRARSDLFVCNFAVFAPEESAIYRTNP